MMRRSAAFTDRAVGKASATSGARTTTLTPSVKCFAYRPRSPLLKSYSGSMSSSESRLREVFFIFAPFGLGGRPSADDSQVVVRLFHVRNNQKALFEADANQQHAVLICRVQHIEYTDAKRIRKSRRRLLERYPVLPQVRHIFSRVPCEAHGAKIGALLPRTIIKTLRVGVKALTLDAM
jgi:hypothetical protein